MINLHFGLGGHYTIHKGKLDSNNDPVTREYVTEFDNMILDSGLYRIGNITDWMDYLHLGTGTTPPSPKQNSLVNATYIGNIISPTAPTEYGINSSDPLNPYCWVTRVFRVSPRGESRTYSELGVGWYEDYVNYLFSRTLIKDSLGNPTSISILGDEYLDVTYEVRMYIPMDTAVYTIVPTGDDLEPREVTVHASNINTPTFRYGWGLGFYDSMSTRTHRPNSICGTFLTNHNRFFNGEGGGLYGDPNGTVVGTGFDAHTKERISDTSMAFHFKRDLPDNIGTLRTFQVSQMGYCFQLEFNPPFFKTYQDRFDISYSISWGRR